MIILKNLKILKIEIITGVWGLGFGVWGLGFGVWGLGFGVWVTKLSVPGLHRVLEIFGKCVCVLQLARTMLELLFKDTGIWRMKQLQTV